VEVMVDRSKLAAISPRSPTRSFMFPTSLVIPDFVTVML